MRRTPKKLRTIPAERPRPFPASPEARQWAELVRAELAEWPAVRFKPMFGMTGVYRGNKIFAVLPRTRSLNSPSSFPLKFHRPSAATMKKIAKERRLTAGIHWIWFEMRRGDEIGFLIPWLNLAYRAAA